VIGGRLDSQTTSEILTAPRDTTSTNKDLKRNGHQPGTQHPPTKTSKETVINLSDQMLDDEIYSLLQKGLNFAMTPCTTLIEDSWG